MMIGIVIVTGGGTTRITEASTDETIGQGPQRESRDPGIGITRDGDALKKE